MRVTQVRPTIVCVPYRQASFSAVNADTAATEVIVQVETDEGLCGVGEALASVCPEAVAAAVRQLATFVVGQSPFDIEAFYQQAFAGRWQFYRHLGHVAAAGIEMALWDIVGKAVGQPIHRLLGGAVRDRVDHYCWVQRQEPAAMAEEALRGREQGFTVFYVKLGLEPRADIAAVEAVRAGAGADRLLRVDANGAWSTAEALNLIRELSRFDLDFVEQPVAITDLEGLAEVRRQCGVPICLDQGAWTRWDIAEALRRGAADYYCTEPARLGGLLEFKKVCGLIDSFHAKVCRHASPELGIAAAAALQVYATVPNLTFGNQAAVHLCADDVIKEDLRTFDRGTLAVSQGPGLGVTLDEEKLARYAEAYLAV
jgi:L-alanine-DL-glutamate epimerase-like enolase superfamily enzyme